MYALTALAITLFLDHFHDVTWVGFGLTFLCMYFLVHLVVELAVQKVAELYGGDDSDKL